MQFVKGEPHITRRGELKKNYVTNVSIW